ncbi:MAG: Tex family protein [Eubacteriales bacterium]
MKIIKLLTDEFKLNLKQVEATVGLIDEGNTIPFIARYRKEVTGSLDDVTLRDLNDRLIYLRSMEKRQNDIRATITDQGKMTEEIEKSLVNAITLTELEDIYRPFKPHRKTRASAAREKGLEDLALTLLMQEKEYDRPLNDIAASFIDAEKGVMTIEEAFDGACDIIAEDISDNAEYRREIRRLTYEYSFIKTKRIESKAEKNAKSDTKASTYEIYHDYTEKLSSMPEHRILAINRAEKEDVIRVDIEMSSDIALNYLFPRVTVPYENPAQNYVSRAVIDSYDRLIAPSIEREIRSDIFDRASESAIKLFAENLKNLLMQAPVKGMTTLGLDPGYRTGCKLAVVDKTGRVLDTAVIYPTIKSENKIDEAKNIMKKLIRNHGVNVIAIGNGTASRESELFVAELLHEIPEDVKYVMVSEAGASVYSASKLAAEEFPNFDVTQRSAVSIARRLQDPLAELIKIDPKSIGVGQYQHDMKPARLDEALIGVVEDAVNTVGVDLNTASYSLLSHVAGIGLSTAKNIVKYREEKGEFSSRAEILKVSRLGAKAYEQCAGFLRVSGSQEILDNTGVHPESYDVARRLLDLFKYRSEDVRQNKLSGLGIAAETRGIGKLCELLNTGEPTLRDIIKELEKPGRDVRDSLPLPVMRTDVMDISDLRPDMLLTGTVRNVIDFGAFVDIGVHQDGLVHVSQISNKYIKHPSEVLSVGDVVKVRVISVDAVKNRISLTMKI